MKITSLQNPKIKEIVALRKAGARKESGLAVVEGLREIQTAISAGIPVDSVFSCPELIKEDAFSTLPGITGKSLFELTEPVFRKIACREGPDGWLALVKPPNLTLNDVRLSANPLVIVLEAVEKPGNLGAILRTADAANADAVVLCDPQTDIYNHNVVRSSIGCIFTRQVVACSSADAIAWLSAKRIAILAATPHGADSYTATDMRGPAAIVLGTEADGLSETWLSAATHRIKIAMKGSADSLNVSTSCAILVFEAIRQREQGQKQ